MPSRFQLRGPTLEAIQAQAAAAYGPGAVIVAAEHVTVGGVAGLLATRYVEATVEVPSPAPEKRAVPAAPGESRRRAMEALLEDASAADTAPGLLPAPVSTSRPGFTALLDTLDSAASQPVPPVTEVPVPATGAGALIVVAGLGQDGYAAAAVLARQLGTDVLSSGLLPGGVRLDDKGQALIARMRARTEGRPVVAGFGLGEDLGRIRSHLVQLQGLEADQVWLAVDAGAKEEDTCAWVKAVTRATAVHALAVTGTGRTKTPETVNALNIPVGLTDGAAARRPVI